MNFSLSTFLALLIFLSTPTLANEPSNSVIMQPMLKKDLFDEKKNSKKNYYWNGSGTLIFSTSFRYKNKPKSIEISPDNPNGIKFTAKFDNGANVKLPIDWPRDFDGVDHLGLLNKGYYIQIYESDLDGDASPEILIATGNGLTDVGVHIFKYYPPEKAEHTNRTENWKELGFLRGQSDAAVEKSSILFRLGGTGRVVEFTLVKGRFLEIN